VNRNTTSTEGYPFNNTVDQSQQRSLEKALAIITEQQKEYAYGKTKAIKRPNVSIKKGLIVLATTLFILFFLVPCFLSIYIDSLGTRILISLAVSVSIFTIHARKIIIWMIKVYQKKAPDELRLSCLFEPSCSDYMLMAIEKYGVTRGACKGIKRFLRCHYPNGGIDNP
jgi:putative membrane protein insertion efficiency factor